MLRVELGKIMSNVVFYLCILATMILLLAGTVYVDLLTGEEYNMIQFIVNDNAQVIKDADLHATDIVVTGVDGYLEMFLPIIVAIPFVMIVCGEKKNSNARFEIYRVGKTRYLVGKFFAAVLSGGLVIMVGYILFSFIVFLVLPGQTGILTQIKYDFFKEETTFGGWYYNSFGVTGMIILKYMRMFFYGLFSAVPAFGLSRIIKNRYIVISIPFMFFYLYSKITVKHESQLLYKAMISNVENVFDTRYLSMITIFGGAACVIALLCRIYLGRKCDCGEE